FFEKPPAAVLFIPFLKNFSGLFSDPIHCGKAKVSLFSALFQRKDFKKTIFSCVRHLISIYSTPYGALPVAKRVAIATMADTWQMAEHAGMNMEEELKNAEDLPKGLLDKILFSVGKFRTVVSGVRKIGL
ncbi:hypothetical protein OESDEN_01217, partial [Oesophagostomum dentatum]